MSYDDPPCGTTINGPPQSRGAQSFAITSPIPGLGRGAVDDLGFSVAELDSQGGVGHQHGDGLPAWMRPKAGFCPATMITPVAEARRWTRTGPAEGWGGGPPGRAPRSRATSAGVSGPALTFRRALK